MYYILHVIVTFSSFTTVLDEPNVTSSSSLQTAVVDACSHHRWESHRTKFWQPIKKACKDRCRTTQCVIRGNALRQAILRDPSRGPGTLTCRIESVKWNIAAEKVEVSVCWSNTSDRIYLCLDSDLGSRISLIDSENRKVNNAAIFSTSRKNEHDVASVRRIYPAKSVYHTFDYSYNLWREASGRVFVELLMGVSGTAELSLGKTYLIQQNAWSPCSLTDGSLVFMEGTSSESHVSTLAFGARYGTWVSGEKGQIHEFAVPSLNAFGESPVIRNWPPVMRAEDIPVE